MGPRPAAHVSDDSIDNKRKYRRYPVKLPLFVALGGDVYRKQIPLESKDISGGGLSFETSRKLPLESETRLIVARLGDLPVSAFIRGRVAHCQKDPGGSRYNVGLEFTDFVHVTQEEVVARIERWQSASPP